MRWVPNLLAKVLNVPADSVARFNLAHCVIWLAASRRRLQTIAGMSYVTTVADGVLFAGEAMQGLNCQPTLSVDLALPIVGLDHRTDEWATAARETPHGRPIVLKRKS